MNDSPTLKRGLGIWDAAALVMGCVIGAGIFRLSSRVAGAAESPSLFLLAWIVAGILSMAGALVFAELSSRHPRTGGDYVFLTEAYGRMWGFLFGWTKLFVQRTGTIAIIGYIFAEYAMRTFGGPAEWVKPVATFAIVSLAIANAVGLTLGKNIQNVFTFLKVAALILIVAVGLIAGKGSAAHFTPFWPEGLAFGRALSVIGVAMIFALWTYGGWEASAYVAEEVRKPEKNLPRSIIRGLIAVTFLYLAVNAVYLYYLPLEEMANTPLVAAAVMDKVWHGAGGRIVSAMVMVSTLGALNGFILVGGRILLAMARDHALFGKMAGVHPKTRTPVAALFVTSGIAVALVWTGTLDQIVTYTEIVIYLFFALTGASVFVFRKRSAGVEAPYKVWGYPVTPAVFIVMCLAFAGNAIADQPFESLLGVGVASIGFPLYLLSRRLEAK